MKTYITFGQIHVHNINGKTFDKDCVAVIESNDAKTGRDLTDAYFGDKFCFTYSEDRFNMDDMKYYSRGFITV